MSTFRFDRIARLFADHRLSRRDALGKGAAGLAATAFAAAGLATRAAAQDASPVAEEASHPGEAYDPAKKVPFLFLQSFQSGSIAPKEGADGTYTLTLQHGLGQTIYFSDRPERIVGATSTPEFLDGLGFDSDDPPNAALVISSPDGTTDVAVVELFNPVFNPDSPGVTYDVQVLAEWHNELEMGFQETPADLASIPAQFGNARLFIDDCADEAVVCQDRTGTVRAKYTVQGFCWNHSQCVPCVPYYHTEPSRNDTYAYWTLACNNDWPVCNHGECVADWN